MRRVACFFKTWAMWQSWRVRRIWELGRRALGRLADREISNDAPMVRLERVGHLLLAVPVSETPAGHTSASGERADSAATDGGPAALDSDEPLLENLRMTEDHEDRDGAEQRLRAIRTGGLHLIGVTRQRVWRALDALAAGDFDECLDWLTKAQSSVGPLAHAQTYIAAVANAKMILAADLEAGMVMTEVGEVSSVEVEECPVPNCRRHVKVMVGEHPLQYHGDQEVYVDA